MNRKPARQQKPASNGRALGAPMMRVLVLAAILEALEGTGGDRRRRRPRKRATGRKKRGVGVKIKISTS